SNGETGACLIEGTRTGVISASNGRHTSTPPHWSSDVDASGLTITQVQTITVEPAPEAVFDAVSPLTLTCDEALVFVATDLDYSNGETGACLIEGTRTGVITGTYDECGEMRREHF